MCKFIYFFIQWSSGHLINLGWSNNEDILCCQDNGLVLVYDLFGNYQYTFSMVKVIKNIHKIPTNNYFVLCILFIFQYFNYCMHSLQDKQDVKLLDARITSNFTRTIVAVLTEIYNIYITNDITKVKVHILPNIPGIYNFTYFIYIYIFFYIFTMIKYLVNNYKKNMSV